MQATGAAQWLATTVVQLLEPIGAAHGLGLQTAMSLLTIGVSNTMTAGAAVAVLGPIVLRTASVVGEDPIIFGFVTAISSSFGYLTPAAQPAFTIIYASGYLKGSDFLKIGLRMMVMSMVLLFVMMSVYWPLLGRLGY
jgi:solute carrier family 13 (sodium-dependent dicarboxylate transporter), member 2/3/5